MLAIDDMALLYSQQLAILLILLMRVQLVLGVYCICFVLTGCRLQWLRLDQVINTRVIVLASCSVHIYS